MGLGKTIAGGIGLGIGIILIVIVLALIGTLFGGLVGAGITWLYNTVLGTSFALTKGAWIGSIVGMVGGASSAGAGAGE